MENIVAQLKYAPEGKRGVALGTRATFADIGETVADFYGLAGECRRGTSFLAEVRGA